MSSWVPVTSSVACGVRVSIKFSLSINLSPDRMKCWCVGQGALARFPDPLLIRQIQFGIPLFAALKTSAFPRRDVDYDWALERAHLWQNGVEHLE